MSESTRGSAAWPAALGALAVALGLAALAWPDLALAQRLGGGLLALLGAAGVVWAASRSTSRRTLIVAAVPALLLTGVLAGSMVQAPPEGPVFVQRSGSIPAAEVNSLGEMHAQMLDVADELVDDGSSRLHDMNLFTDLDSGSFQVVRGEDVLLRARLSIRPQREWQWEERRVDFDPPSFDGRAVTFDYDTVVGQLTDKTEAIGMTPRFETVWISPPVAPRLMLETANPAGLPVAQFNSRQRGRDLQLQVLGDGTIPDTYYDVADPAAAREQILAVLRDDARGVTTAAVQVLSARTPTRYTDGPVIDDRPLQGGVEFRGTVDGEFLQIAVPVGQFPTLYSRTPDDALGFLPLADLPVEAMRPHIPTSEFPHAWQFTASEPRPTLRVIDAPGAPVDSHEL
ncbi:hypothetical protein [Corynebacterium sp.]|uniref:hypothetical protein n=1 Tax=Corynebacterium sp. TaxID=1720 RepID=UPI0026DFBB95|nr:hypothetical protein [Corynebacterium sp.]MDO5513240.1 hypothetical protein [Corynebacterium sp.]